MRDSRAPEDKASRDVFEAFPSLSSSTVWGRVKGQDPACGFGLLGNCCNHCNLGPCRIDPFGEGAKLGACGATVDTIAARSLVRQIAAGSAAHSDHARELVLHLSKIAAGPDPQEAVKDPEKLDSLARELEISPDGADVSEKLRRLSGALLSHFTRHEGILPFTSRAPAKRRETWSTLGITPGGIDRELVETLHRTNVGVDNDYRSLILSGMKAALADGWGGSMIATELTDILFGSPRPVRSLVNLGVLKKNAVNILVHGHEPVFANAIADAAQRKDLVESAREHGAEEGINVAGICCTASELLMRKGIPVAGSFLQQELALMTRAVDLMVVNYQCVMPSLPSLASCLHTRLVTTSPKARFPGIDLVETDKDPGKAAEALIRQAIDAFSNRRDADVFIPDETMDVVAGFTAENVRYHLGGTFRGSYRPLNDNIANGRIRGVAAVIGCDNPRMRSGATHVLLARELLRHDVLVIQTGCAATACAKEGLLRPEAAFEFAGEGLREVCEAVGIPPVLHNGACVDNSRILIECCEMVREGGLGEDLSDLPVAAAAPEWMSEKAIAIGWYAVASGILTVLGSPLRVVGSQAVRSFICDEIETLTGGKFVFESDPSRMAEVIIAHLDKKRAALNLQPMRKTLKSGERAAAGGL
jgi:carbon-monoxide dehydrogenase catalytic subunit